MLALMEMSNLHLMRATFYTGCDFPPFQRIVANRAVRFLHTKFRYCGVGLGSHVAALKSRFGSA